MKDNIPFPGIKPAEPAELIQCIYKYNSGYNRTEFTLASYTLPADAKGYVIIISGNSNYSSQSIFYIRGLYDGVEKIKQYPLNTSVAVSTGVLDPAGGNKLIEIKIKDYGASSTFYYRGIALFVK